MYGGKYSGWDNTQKKSIFGTVLKSSCYLGLHCRLVSNGTLVVGQAGIQVCIWHDFQWVTKGRQKIKKAGE